MEFTLLCGKPRQPLFQIEHTNTRFIYDDGYTGTNFNRLGWQEVMELMESEQVGTLIVKDMSRLGREYLQVGQYTELVFPSYGARIASRPLYGYMKDPEDPKRHIVPDPDTAPVVKRIFALCADGMGPSKNAQLLEKD